MAIDRVFVSIAILLLAFATLKANSYERLQLLFEQNMQDESINLKLGLKAMELKKYDEAVSAFERVLIYNKNSYRAKLEIAKAYYYQGSYQNSKNILLSLNSIKIPKYIQMQRDKYLIMIEAKKKKLAYTTLLMIGSQYDSNINNSQQNIISDFSYNATSIFLHKYQINRYWSISNSIVGHYKDYFFHDTFNMKLLSYKPSFNYHEDRGSFDLAMYFDNIWYSSNYNMLSYGITPSYKYVLNDKETLYTDIKYLIKIDQLNTNTDFKLYDITIGNKIDFINRLDLFMGYHQELFINNSLDRSSYKLGFIYGFDITKPLSLNISYKYKDIKYRIKTDTQNILNTTATYRLPKEFIIKFNIGYLKNSSTIVKYGYDKSNIGLNLIKTF